MKKKIAFLLLVALLVTGCNNNHEYGNIENPNIEIEYLIPTDYDFNNAIDDGFVVYQMQKVSNESKIDEFINDTINKKDSTLTTIHYTIEGDAVVQQFQYKNGKYYVIYDATRDAHSNSKEVTKKEIAGVKMEINPNGNTKYLIEK